jgi:hypothetical protein
MNPRILLLRYSLPPHRLAIAGLRFACLLYGLCSMPCVLLAQENVGIGTLTPAFKLDVQGPNATSPLAIINAKANYVGTLDVRAIDGYSVTADGYGIGGKFTGGYRGIEVLGAGGAYSGTMYGTFSQATGTAGTRIGVYGTASGGATNRGVMGIVNGGANFAGIYGENQNTGGYAGYFMGRGFFTQELRADKNMVVDDSLFTHHIRNTSGPLDIEAVLDIECIIDRNNSAGVGFFELFNGSGTQLFFVNESGTSRTFGNHYVDLNMGIGTLTPTTKLQIINGTDASLSTHGFAQFGTTASWNVIIDDNEIMARNNGSGNDFIVQGDAGNVLLCGAASSTGRVGIGVATAADLGVGYLLSVDGKVIAEELRIQNSTSWPDYVFSKEYDLMPLDELKNSIAVNNHLPNIPPAVEVEADGILVGDMQVRMMEKIEELTLYILQLHETNKHLQAQIDALSVSRDQ